MTFRTCVLVTFASMAAIGCAKTAPATEDDKAKAHAACAMDVQYQASESAEAEKTLDAYCAHADCPGKPTITALCIFRDPGGAPLAEINSTIQPRDTANEEAACDTVRASGAISMFQDLDLYCKNDKRCMTCGSGAR